MEENLLTKGDHYGFYLGKSLTDLMVMLGRFVPESWKEKVIG